jgi:hypothetical protein
MSSVVARTSMSEHSIPSWTSILDRSIWKMPLRVIIPSTWRFETTEPDSDPRAINSLH